LSGVFAIVAIIVLRKRIRHPRMITFASTLLR